MGYGMRVLSSKLSTAADTTGVAPVQTGPLKRPVKAVETDLLGRVQVRYLHSPHQRVVAGFEPGTMLAATAQAPLRVTLSHAALDSNLRALAWWRNATAPGADVGALYRHAAAADNAAVLTDVHNATGEPLRMWMDLGGRTKTVPIEPGSQRLMEPLVRPVERPGSAAAAGSRRPPAMLLSVTLHGLELEVRWRRRLDQPAALLSC